MLIFCFCIGSRCILFIFVFIFFCIFIESNCILSICICFCIFCCAFLNWFCIFEYTNLLQHTYSVWSSAVAIAVETPLGGSRDAMIDATPFARHRCVRSPRNSSHLTDHWLSHSMIKHLPNVRKVAQPRLTLISCKNSLAVVPSLTDRPGAQDCDRLLQVLALAWTMLTVTTPVPLTQQAEYLLTVGPLRRVPQENQRVAASSYLAHHQYLQIRRSRGFT